MNIKRFFIIMLCVFFIDCMSHHNNTKIIEKNFYSVHQQMTVGVVEEQESLKDAVRESTSRWNRWIGKEVFKFNTSFLSSLRSKYLILVLDGDDQSGCTTRPDVSAFAIAHLDINDGHARGGRIFLCKSRMSFNNRLGNRINIRDVLTHELGHMLSTGHYQESNLLHPHRTYPFPNNFDKQILIPIIQSKVRFQQIKHKEH